VAVTGSTDTTPLQGSPPARRVVWLAIASCCILLPNIVAVVGKHEYFPLTWAPMFAVSPVDNERVEIDINFIDRHGAVVVVDEGKITGVHPRNFRRSLFLTAWASDDGRRQHRLERLFAGVADLQRRKRSRTFQDIVAIDVVAVVRPADGAPPTRTPIGRYQVKGERFVWAAPTSGGGAP
jgi:hypothetical protein